MKSETTLSVTFADYIYLNTTPTRVSLRHVLKCSLVMTAPHCSTNHNSWAAQLPFSLDVHELKWMRTARSEDNDRKTAGFEKDMKEVLAERTTKRERRKWKRLA